MENIVYKLVKLGLRSQYKKPKIYGKANIDQSTPAVFLSNHERFYGPIIIATRFPVHVRTWATSLMTDISEAKIYVKETLFMDTLHMKEGIAHILGSMAAYPISWTVRQSNPIPAYWDPKRSHLSIKKGLEAIKNGESQLMYAPNRKPSDEAFYFMQGFSMLAKFAHSRFGIIPKFYPVALNKHGNSIAIGNPTFYDPEKSFKEECVRVNAYIIEQIRIGYDHPKKMANGFPAPSPAPTT